MCVSLFTLFTLFTGTDNHVLADIFTWILGKIFLLINRDQWRISLDGYVVFWSLSLTSWRSLVFWSNENDRACDLLHTNAKQGCLTQGPRCCRHGCAQDRNLQTGMEKINSEQSQLMHVHALQFDKVSWVWRDTYNPITLRLRLKNHKLPWAAY